MSGLGQRDVITVKGYAYFLFFSRVLLKTMIVIAHNIRSLHNVGSIFRSCDAFGVKKLYLTGFTGIPPRKEIAKVSLGSEHRVSWEALLEIKPLLQILKQQGFCLVALDNTQGSIPIHMVKKEKPLVLILGNEVEGIEKEVLVECNQQI